MSLQVKDVMVTSIITIEADSTVKNAAELMEKHDIGCLVVINYGNPVGIVTERDMLKKVLLQRRDSGKTKVGSVMSAPLITSHPQDDIRDAVRLMNERRIKKLPVLEDGKLIGLVSLTDVMRSLAYFEHVISSLCDRCQLGQQGKQQKNRNDDDKNNEDRKGQEPVESQTDVPV
jgi:CBS domain-containing protein